MEVITDNEKMEAAKDMLINYIERSREQKKRREEMQALAKEITQILPEGTYAFNSRIVTIRKAQRFPHELVIDLGKEIQTL